MSARATLATASRVISQLRRDPRTIALLIVVPCVLVFLVDQVLADRPEAFQRVGVPLLGLFPLVSMFLVTSITMLRERTSGTLERLLTLPIAKLDLLLGYGIAFAAVAAVQATVVSFVGFGLLDLSVGHSKLLVVALAIANAVLGMSLGLFSSAFARTEFQAVQFMPAFILPQLLLCGLFVARADMARLLEAVSWALPLTYAYDALQRATDPGALGWQVAADAAVVLGAALLSLALGALTLHRRTA